MNLQDSYKTLSGIAEIRGEIVNLQDSRKTLSGLTKSY
jgi:hypothetical protein